METKTIEEQLKDLFKNGTNYQKAYLLIMAKILTSDNPDECIANLKRRLNT